MRTNRLLSLAQRIERQTWLDEGYLTLPMQSLLREIKAELVYLAKDADPLLREHLTEKE